MNESQKYYSVKKARSKCLIPFIRHSGKGQNNSDSKQTRQFSGAWIKAGDDYKRSPENFAD